MTILISVLATLILSAAAAAVLLRKKTAQLRKSEKEMAQKEVLIADLKGKVSGYERTMAELKEQHRQQLDLTLAQLKTASDEMLRQREKELRQTNRESMDGILNPLKQSISEMKEAMKSNAETHIRRNTELQEQLRRAVDDMKKETSEVGHKADTLSEALTGRPKVQGCFGESCLNDILRREGFTEGKHYDREVANEDHSRPDFVFHFMDGTEQKDLIVDSKVSLTAYVAYMNAGTQEEREAAMADHLKSIRRHIEELARKEYAKKVKHPFADYVLMFMPRDMALRAALDTDPMLWQNAYEKGVLIVTEQSVVPFLKILELAWKKFSQDTSIAEVTAAADRLIERVGAFYDSYRELGRKLGSVCKEYNSGIVKLRDDGMSITTSARQVMKIGAKRQKGKSLEVPDEEYTLES